MDHLNVEPADCLGAKMSRIEGHDTLSATAHSSGKYMPVLLVVDQAWNEIRVLLHAGFREGLAQLLGQVTGLLGCLAESPLKGSLHLA